MNTLQALVIAIEVTGYYFFNGSHGFYSSSIRDGRNRVLKMFQVSIQFGAI
jgi:hypothetical protein